MISFIAYEIMKNSDACFNWYKCSLSIESWLQIQIIVYSLKNEFSPNFYADQYYLGPCQCFHMLELFFFTLSLSVPSSAACINIKT